MANKKIVDLTALITNVDSNISEISDTAGTNPSMKITELQRKTYVNTNPTISGGSANNIVIGNTTPAAGFFNELVWTETGSHFSTNQVVDPIVGLSKVFQMDVAGTSVSAQSVSDYVSGFNFFILNSSNGNVTFIPDPPDLVNGASSLIISSNTAVQIMKNFSGITQWSVLSDNATSTGQPFLIANNLSESTNFPTLRNNIGANIDFGFDVSNSNIVLTNPCQTWFEVSGNSAPISITFPVMNSTTPGAKSLIDGQVIRVINYGTSTLQLKYSDGSNVGNGLIGPGHAVWMVVIDNSSPGGLFNIDYSSASPFNGGTGVSNPTAHTLPVAEGASNFTFLGPLTNGQLLIGSNGADPVPATLTAGTGVSISSEAGRITISASGSGLNYVELDVASVITMAADTVYIINNGGTNLLTLPTNPVQGTTFGAIGIAGTTGNFEIRQGDATQSIQWTSSQTTIGTSGKIISTDDFNCLTITTTLSTEFTTLFTVTGNQGINYTFV